MDTCLTDLNSAKEIPIKEAKIEELQENSLEHNINLELKLLPDHLKYVFFDEEHTKPVITTKFLNINEETKLIQVLKRNQDAIN